MGKKLCECGCGKPTNIATKTNNKQGYIKGEQVRYIAGHQYRGKYGSLSYNWSGGKVTDNRGYVSIKKPSYPRSNTNGYVREHVLVAERVIGKPLPPSAAIHHVDGNPSNNEKSNLVVCEDNKYHKLLHKRQRALDACGIASWLKCRFCKEYDDPENMYVYKKTGSGCHRECHNKYERDRRAGGY